MTQKYFLVSGVCCSTEQAVLAKRLDNALGRDKHSFNLLTSELAVAGDLETDRVLQAIREAGFQGRPKADVAPEKSFWERHGLGVITAGSALIALAGGFLEETSAWHITGRALLAAAILVAGWNVFLKALGSLRTLSLDMNVLMSTAVVGAIAIDEWTEAAAVMVLYSVSLMLETYSTSRTRAAVQSLMTLAPDQATVLRHGHEHLVAVANVSPGDRILIRPGEKVPVDGVVDEGNSTINESVLTGESTPVQKKQGSPVFAGTLNERGSLTVQVTTPAGDTRLARITQLMEEAQRSRAPVQAFVDTFARYYTPSVFAGAILVAVVPPLFLAEPFGEWFYKSLVLLVIACPCALVISTPVTIVSALTNAARNGILVKGGRHLEALAKVRAVAFDKTGTLTRGRPAVSDVILLNSMDKEEVLRRASALERQSEHHIATAITEKARELGIDVSGLAVHDFEATPGSGVAGTMGDMRYAIGNIGFAEQHRFSSTATRDAVAQLSAEGKTTAVLGVEEEPLAVFGIRDEARHQARGAIARLKDLGVHVSMLSGDRRDTAAGIARHLGLDDHHAELMPEQKISRVKELMGRHTHVAAVGDGVNDAPALAASSVGVAMGVSGSDTTLSTADVVLMSDDLSRIPYLLTLGRRTLRVIRQNIAFALAIKGAFLLLSLAGVATLWMAVLADDGAALVVILNGLRVLSLKPEAIEHEHVPH